MTNASSFMRSLVIYAVCLPLAILLGYLLTNPVNEATIGTIAVVLFLLCLPLLMKFHNTLLVVAWNSTVCFAMLPGNPHLWLLTALLSLSISIARRTLDMRFRFISAPELTRPFLLLLAVILVTAKLTGGIGLRSMGGSVYGGSRYLFIICSIVGYFALTAYRIPEHRANFFVGLFFLSGITNFIGDFYYGSGTVTRLVYLFFAALPTQQGESFGTTRYVGIAVSSGFIVYYMLARYGIQDLFNSRRPWRLLLFIFFMVLGLFGGFRSVLITYALALGMQFYLEKLYRTRLLPVFILLILLLGTLAVPFANRLPFTIQRSISFLPVDLDPEARFSADTTSEWRVEIWKAMLPQIPHYLWLGKGYGLAVNDFEFSTSKSQGPIASADQQGAALAGDYHNGPLSVIIPFGIWGAIAWLWLVIAGGRVLYLNYRNSSPALMRINRFLFAYYICRLIMFFFVFGGLHHDLMGFAGLFGFSVSLNGGVCRTAPAPAPAPQPAAKALRFPARLAPL